MRRSLRVSLTLWLATGIVFFALAAIGCAFISVREEATEQQDDLLRQVGAIFSRHELPAVGLRLEDTPDIHRRAGLIIQKLDMSAAPEPVPEPPLPGLPADLPPGLRTIRLEHVHWRVFVTAGPRGERFVVAQRTAMRDEIAYEGIGILLIPLALLLAGLVTGIGLVIRRVFRPVEQLARSLDRRGEQDLGAVSEAGIPGEILPFVAAINRLLERVSSSARQQRRFVADAAHELRSPLTALSLQAEGLETAEMSPAARARLLALRGGLRRAVSLLEQMLTLARALDGGGSASAGDKGAVAHGGISLHGVFRRVLEDLLPLAEDKSLDVGVTGEDVQVAAPVADLRTLVKNLVDNAIRYTPPGGRVDLEARMEGNEAVLTVADTGHGIAEEEYKRVFDPFYRIPGNDVFGSGLGLSIAKAIAERLGGSIRLAASCPGTALPGLRVSVRLPVRGE